MDESAYWRRPTNVRRSYVEGRFGQMHYRIAEPMGAGRVPVLFIHSSPSSGRMYEAVLADLGRDRIAVAGDTPGFGDSDPPLAPPEIPDYAAAHGDLADALGLTQLDLVGYHTGSKVCLELAQQRPGLVRRIVLVSAPVYSAEELARQKVDYADPGVPRDGSHLASRWAFMMRWRKPDTPLIVAQRSLADSLKGGRTAHWGHRAAFNYHHAENLPKVDHPVLVINPDDDLVAPTARAAPLLRNGRIIEAPTWAHGFIDVHTGDFTALLRGFFDGPAQDRTTGGAAKGPPARPARIAVSGARRFLPGRHGLVHVRIAGAETRGRRPLMLFHMSPNSSRIYEGFLAAMGRDRLTVAVDTPGFGESDAPATMPAIEDYAQQMAEVADSLGLAAVDVMGYHTGSHIAMELALRRPTLVRHVVMVSAPLYTEDERALRHARNRPMEIRPDGSHNVERFRFIWQFYGEDVPGEIVARNFAESLRGGPMSWWGHRAAFNYPMRERLPMVRQPVLVLNPNDDLAQQTPRAKDLLRRGRIHDFPRYSHGMLDAHTDEVAGVVRGFVDSP